MVALLENPIFRSVAATTDVSLFMRDHSAHITKTPGVCGGSARVSNTRIPVWGLEKSRREGCTEGDVLTMYPTLTLPGLLAAWHYAAIHRSEMDDEISANEA